MKSLTESLFDKDLTSKDIKFGDKFKPVVVYGLQHGATPIFNMFVMSKLKKAAPYKVDLSDVMGCQEFDKLREPLEYILSIVAELPLKEKFITHDLGSIVYDSLLRDGFADLVRNNLYGRTVWLEIIKLNGHPSVFIVRSNANGRDSIRIDYEEI